MNCRSFIAQSFAVRTAAHLLHLSSSSYAQHIALGGFYGGLVPLIDRYAETYMGMTAQIKSFPPVAPPTGTPITVLEDYLEMVQAEHGEESEALENILAELEELTAQTLYKLRNLK